MIDIVSIGKIIQNFRIEKGITQEQLAEKVELSPNYLSKVERGLCKLNVETFLKIAEVLDFSLEDFGISSKENLPDDMTKKELLKLILTSPSKNIQIYSKFIKLLMMLSIIRPDFLPVNAFLARLHIFICQTILFSLSF